MFGRKRNTSNQQVRGNEFIKNTDKDEPIPQKKDFLDIALLKSEKSQRAFGIILISISIFLFISLISFLFSWSSDQNLIQGLSWQSFKDSHQNGIKNIMGILGARAGHLFIFRGFGIASLLLTPLVFVKGLSLFGIKKYDDFLNSCNKILFATLWISLFMGLFAFSTYNVLAGSVGYFGVVFLKGILGFLGTILFLLAILSIHLIFSYDLEIFKSFTSKIYALLPSSLFAKKNTENIVNAETSSNTAFNSETISPATEKPIDLPVDLNINNPVEKVKPKKTDDLVDGIQLKSKPEIPVEKEPETIKIETNSEDFTIEVVKTEEEVEAKSKDLKPEHYGLDTQFDPTLELSDYKYPPLDLLTEPPVSEGLVDMEEVEKRKNMIVQTLQNYNIGISKIKATVGPTVTLYEIIPAAGVKISKIKNLEDDIALSLSALGIRIIAPIPGKGTIGIEVPNQKPELVSIKSVLSSKKFAESKYELPVVLGKTINNEIYIADLTKMPHILMAGATGQGKSVGLNVLLVSILYKKHPAYVKFVLIDPKKVELSIFKKIERHFLAKLPGDNKPAVITDNSQVVQTLNSLCEEMDNRYQLLQDAMCRNLIEYNNKFKDRKLNPKEKHRFLPYIVVVIDEFADLIMTAGKEIETPVARIAQLARAVGIHMILATQRPSVDIITGKIKANFPARAAFRVSSKIDSRTILDSNGADQLIGKGDLLYSAGNDLIRLQCPFVSTEEVDKLTDFIGSQRAYPEAYILPEVQEATSEHKGSFDIEARDTLFEDAARVIVQNQQGSTSMIQRRLKIGYNRAGRIIDQMEHVGLVGPFEGSKARQVLIKDMPSLEQFLDNLE